LTRRRRRQKATQKIKFECNTSEKIKKTFEDFFESSKENKMDLFDFYNIVEECEIDVSRSCSILYEQHFKNYITKKLCGSFCRKRRMN
jgi:hypothetical protein